MGKRWIAGGNAPGTRGHFGSTLKGSDLFAPLPLAGGPTGLLGPSLANAVLWSAYSMGLCVAGWLRVSSFLRWAGVALLLVSSVRVLLVDMVAMSGPARIAAFLLLAVFLLVISYLFQSRTKRE